MLGTLFTPNIYSCMYMMSACVVKLTPRHTHARSRAHRRALVTVAAARGRGAGCVMLATLFSVLLLVLPVSSTDAGEDSNPNCVSRGHCTTVGPGTKYPEQNTMCLKDSPSSAPREGPGAWHCTNTGGKWGTIDHTFGPGSTFDMTSECTLPALCPFLLQNHSASRPS
jgi:hypothetical protein